MRRRIEKSLTVREIMEKYDLPKTTAWRAKRRGWYAPNYHEKAVELGIMTDEEAIKLYQALEWVQDEDIVQDTMLRMVELAGRNIENPIGYATTIARNLMKKCNTRTCSLHSPRHKN
jgi:hypothetical protein